MKLSINRWLPIASIAAFTVLAAGAQATHWPQTGGNAGRAGHQPADRAVLPMKFRWRQPESVATSPIITSGSDLVAQRFAYGHYTNDGTGGTDLNGRVRIARLANRVNPTDTDIDDESPRDGSSPGTSDDDLFGPAGDVAPLEASTHTGGPTQIYAVHNDDNQPNFEAGTGPGGSDATTPNPNGNDLALAQIDAASGARVRDFSIGSLTPGSGFTTNGYTIESAPVIGPDDGGARDIYFVARSATDKRLFRLAVAEAETSGPNTFTLEVTGNIGDLNTKARPALIQMLSKAGTQVTMVAVATSDGVKTFRAKNLSDPGPSIAGLGNTTSPAVPVRADGNAATRPTFFYVASSSGNGTIVRKLRQEPGEANEEALMNLEVLATSPELSGTPGPGIAVAQEIPLATGAAPAPGRVVVGTSSNLYSLNTESLGAENPPRLFSEDVAAASGFSQTIPATSGELGFVVTRDGDQIVFYLTPRNGSMRVVLGENGFIPNEDSLDATSSLGQPALSRGRVVFPSNNGAYSYGPNISIISPAPASEVNGTVALSAHVVDNTVTSITFRVDGLVVGSGPVTGNVASFNWNSNSVGDGPHVVTAEAGDERSAERPIIVDNFAPPIAQLTVSPNVPNVGQNATLNASGSTPTPGEPNDAIVQWAFEIDGDNDYNDIVEGAGGDGIVTTQFSTPGTKTVGVRVTDGHGDTAIKTVSFRVNNPPTVTLTASPNPAAAGQQVTIDATGSTDTDGSIAKYEFDFDGNSTFEHDNGTNPKATRALAATTTVGVRVTDNEGGQSIKTVTVNVTQANQPPSASFIVAPNPAVTNQDVGFSAAASKDPDGKIDKYEWDFDGNGSFERNTGTSPLAAHRFTTAGVYKVGLRVTDNAGATGTTTVDVIISGSRCVAESRCTPRLTASVTPKRDRKLPYRFTTRGRLGLPTGVGSVDGCAGRVSVQVKRGKRTLSTRRAKVRSNCRFTSTVKFSDRRRLGKSRALRFKVRFLGNKLLKPRSTTRKTVRIG